MYKRHPTISREEYLADKIREYILEKALEGGEQLPSVKEFAKMFSAGKETVSGAIELLSIAGLVRIKPKYGVFVIKDPFADFREKINWEKIKNRNENFHLNPRLTHSLASSDTQADSFNASLPFLTEEITQVILSRVKSSNLCEPVSSVDLFNAYFGQGLYELRVSLSEHMASYGVRAEPEEIILIRSPRDAVTLLGMLLIAQGGTIFYEKPSVLFSQTYINATGGRMCGINIDKYGINIAELTKNIKEEKNTVLYTYPVFTMPLGNTASKTRKQEVLNLTSLNGIPIVEFDLYRDLDSHAPKPYYALSKNSSVIYTGSFYEILPHGFSLSWIAAPQKILRMIKELHFLLDFTVPHQNQRFVNSILNDGSYLRYLDTLKDYLKDRAEFADSIMNKHLRGIVKWSGGHPYVYWVELPFAGKVLQNNRSGLSVSLGDLYSRDHPNHIVVSKVSPVKERYEEAIIALKNLLLQFIR
jgi:DNA-binding transcriptional MocR family regulator